MYTALLLKIVWVACTFESYDRADSSGLHWAFPFTISGIYSSNDSLQWRMMNDDVILVFNKDIVNIITFNWSQMLKTPIIPTVILIFQLSVFYLVGMTVILSYTVTTLGVSSCNYWLIFLSYLLDKAVLLNILYHWGQRRINSSYPRLTLGWISSFPSLWEK